MSAHGKPLREARIDPAAVSYHVLRSNLALVATLVLIPFIVVWLPFSLWYYRRWHRRLEVRLHDRVLRIGQGLMFRVEKTIPLDEITDVAIVQGPLMRIMHLHGIRVETAGQTSGAGQALASVVGVVGTTRFRDAVLEQRDTLRGDRSGSTVHGAGQEELLRDILNTLKRIEKTLKSS